mgnify:CR=1 FL=1
MKPRKHIYINHSFYDHKQRMFSYDENNHHNARLRYLTVCALDDGTITTKNHIHRIGKKSKALYYFYNDIIKMFEKQYDNYVLHFHIHQDMRPYNLHKGNKASHVFYYDNPEEYDIQQNYLAIRCETEARRFSAEHAFRNHQLFTNQDVHNSMSIETFHVATDGSIFYDKHCGFGVAIGQDGTMYRSQMNSKSSNEVEARGIALAIEKFARKGRHLVIHTDSECVLSHIYMAYFPEKFAKKNGEVASCFKALNNAIENGCKISFVKVKAHSGDMMNTSADKIARMSTKQVAQLETKKMYDHMIQKEIITMMKKLYGKKNVKNNHVVLNNDSAHVVFNNDSAKVMIAA